MTTTLSAQIYSSLSLFYVFVCLLGISIHKQKDFFHSFDNGGDSCLEVQLHLLAQKSFLCIWLCFNIFFTFLFVICYLLKKDKDVLYLSLRYAYYGE